MELIIQKAVELGAWEIVPVASKRSVVKLDAKKAQAKQKRWQAISESAAKQCKRLHVPKITPVCTWEEALARAGETDVRLFPYELAEDMEQTRRTVGAIRPASRWRSLSDQRAALPRRRPKAPWTRAVCPLPLASGFCGQRRRE